MSTATEGFNADSRARKREGQPVTIGGIDFKRVRRTPKVMRKFRAIVREDEQLAKKFADLEDDDIAGREEIEDQREELMYTMVAVFIAAPEDLDRETPLGDVAEFVSDELDIEDCSALLDDLTPGSSPDPTPADTPQPTSS